MTGQGQHQDQDHQHGDAALERYPGKRNGLPQSDIYGSPSFQASLQPLVDRLRAQQQTDVISAFPSVREVSKLLCDVLGFLESAYGRYALTKPFPKLPYSVFRDLSAGGGVEILLKNVAGHIKTVTVPVHNRKKIDWTSPALRKELQELMAGVRTELVRAGCVRQFKVYFDKGIKNIEQLTEEKGAVVRLGGVVAGSAKEAGVTHIVVPNAKEMKDGREGGGGEEGGGDAGEEEYFWRTVAKGGDGDGQGGLGDRSHALVHWWYLPDSYNEYVPVESAPAEVDADEVPPNGRPWVVHERWVVDSEKYNEWMNEGDYETEESAEENKRVREAKAAGGGVYSLGVDEPQRKKTKKELRVEEAAMEVDVGVVRVLAPGVVERAVRVVDRKTVEAVHVPTIDLSHGYRQQWMGVGGVSGSTFVSSGDRDGDRGGELPRRHAIPFAAGWFDKKAVHHIELREFIEFQKEYKGPGWEEYRTMRNHIVDAFGNNPGRRLSFRDVSNDVCADGMLVLKIYKFLDRWGIINRFDLDGAGHDPGNLELATRAGMASILSASKKPFAINEAMELWITGGRHTKTRLRPGTMQQYAVVPTGYIVPEPGKARFCAARPWVRCDGKHYAMSAAKGGGGEKSVTPALATTGLVLCVDAYKNGEFPPGTSAKDFVLLDGAPARPEDLAPSNAGTIANKKPFSPQEDLLLLESINKNCQKVGFRGSNGQMQHKPLYDWTAIAKDVSGRNEAECVERYLSYPIEESLLMAALDFDEPFPLLSLHEDGSASVPDRYRRAPYNSTDKGGKKSDVNPLVGNLATILYVIGPEVASDAARHAIESIVEQLAEEGTTGDVKMEEAKAEEAKAEDARYGVDIGVLRNASFEAISKASVKAQELAHERLMSMYSIVMRMCDVQLERIWEKCDYLEQLVDIGSGVTE